VARVVKRHAEFTNSIGNSLHPAIRRDKTTSTEEMVFGVSEEEPLMTKSCVAVLATLVVTPCAAFAGPVYTVTDLGTLVPGYQSIGQALNNKGEVVGYAGVPTPTTTVNHAFLYSGRVMHDLGTLGGPHSEALGINDSGQVTGFSYLANGAAAFLYSGGIMQNLGGTNSAGLGINSSGTVVGYSQVNGGANHAALFRNGTVNDLGTLPGGVNSEAAGINDSGQITGDSQSSRGTHAFVYSAGAMHDLGTLPGWIESRGVAINSIGEVAGNVFNQNGASYHAFLYSGGTMHDLGTLGGAGSFADGINDKGQVVGFSYLANGDSRAFLYKNGVMTDLESLVDTSLGWHFGQAYAINNAGQITGIGEHLYYVNGVFHADADAFLLTQVPEPSTLTLAFVVGVTLLTRFEIMRHRRRSRIHCDEIPAVSTKHAAHFTLFRHWPECSDR
jgi:probable HAF family extracellular repeat protein